MSYLSGIRRNRLPHQTWHLTAPKCRNSRVQARPVPEAGWGTGRAGDSLRVSLCRRHRVHPACPCPRTYAVAGAW
jgi:hypothetical protein